MSKITAALCGNPNSGKTTLFNLLTGSNQKIGNWAGVTVERKQGVCRSNPDVVIVDTPGAYSLSPYSPDEKITADYVKSGEPDIIINVVDSTNLERNLLLTTQLAEINAPQIIALNFKDEAESSGIRINTEILEKEFKCKVFYISAAKNEGIEELIEYCASRPKKTKATFPCDITERYGKIKDIVNAARQTDKCANSRSATDVIDKFVLNKYLAFPIFFAVMTLIFYLSIGSVGKLLTSVITDCVTPLLRQGAENLLTNANSPALTSLICDGIINGVMSVVSFVPQIMLLFGCISILEASGYMARIAFITDRLLNKIGLGGRSFVSMILGFGCSVPAIMAARTIKNTNERNATITLTPFMPCSAKLAIISFFTAKVFDGNALFAISFYIVSIATAIFGGLIIKTFRKNCKNYDDAFIMELPHFRAPKLTNVIRQMTERGKSFLAKAGTVIFAASVLLWLMQNFNFRLQYVSANDGMLANMGKLIAPIFAPLGFNDGGFGWQFSVAALSGIAAKETVVTTLEILLPASVNNCISTLGAYCFVTYNLLTAPCIAAVSASFAEIGGTKNGIKALTFQIAAAYAITLVIYQTGLLFDKYRQTAIIAIATAAIVSAVIFAAVRFVKNRKHCCGDCRGCRRQ